MFGFLKQKLKNVISRFSQKIDEQGKEEVKEEVKTDITAEAKEELAEKEVSKHHEQISKINIVSDINKEPKFIRSADKPLQQPVAEQITKTKLFIKEPEAKVPSIYELAQRKKQQEKEKKHEPEDIERVESPKAELFAEKEQPEEKEKPLSEKAEQAAEQEEPAFIREVDELEDDKQKEQQEGKKITANELLEEIERSEKPVSELTAQDILKEAEKLELPEDKIPTAKEVIAGFAKEREEKKLVEQEEPKGFFAKLKQKIVTKRIDEQQFDDIFWDLEVGLMENNVAIAVIDKIKSDLKDTLVDKPILRGKIPEAISQSLKGSITQLFDVDKLNLVSEITMYRQQNNKPYVICFLGINGSGKTTSIAKVAKLLQNNSKSCVIVAGDTFRAAAIQQLEEHGAKLNVKVIKHDYGADAAAVGFDGIKYAEAHNLDAVLIDTAGRMQSNVNLMDELKKIIRVNQPNLNIFVGESITGNDCVEQAKEFDDVIGIGGIILTKADVDDKGGAALSISYVTKKPILYIGTGQEYDDFEEFDKEKIIANLGLEG